MRRELIWKLNNIGSSKRTLGKEEIGRKTINENMNKLMNESKTKQ